MSAWQICLLPREQIGQRFRRCVRLFVEHFGTRAEISRFILLRHRWRGFEIRLEHLVKELACRGIVAFHHVELGDARVHQRADGLVFGIQIRQISDRAIRDGLSLRVSRVDRERDRVIVHSGAVRCEVLKLIELVQPGHQLCVGWIDLRRQRIELLAGELRRAVEHLPDRLRNRPKLRHDGEIVAPVFQRIHVTRFAFIDQRLGLREQRLGVSHAGEDLFDAGGDLGEQFLALLGGEFLEGSESV